MPYTDPNVVHNPATGTVAPAAWGDTIRDDLEFLIDPPACSISAAAKTVTNNTTTVLGDSPGATENYDNDGMHSNVTNRSRITIQTAGRYTFLGAAVTASFLGDEGILRISLRVNGTDSYGGMQIKNPDSSVGVNDAVRLLLVRTLVLSVGDYVEMTTVHNVGASIDWTMEELVARFTTR